MRVFFDTETTGLSPARDEILQLSIIDEHGNTLWNRKYKPSHVQSWNAAQRIHGISPKDVRKERYITDDITRIQSIFDRADKVYAYNAPFDLKFLNAVGIKIPNSKVIDTMQAYGMQYHNTEYYKLEDAARECGYQYHAHDALEDCKATLVVQNKIDSAHTIQKSANTAPKKAVDKAPDDADTSTGGIFVLAVILLIISLFFHWLFFISIPLLILGIIVIFSPPNSNKPETPEDRERRLAQAGRFDGRQSTSFFQKLSSYKIKSLNPYVDADDIRPRNVRPKGYCIAFVGLGVDVIGEEKHQDLLKKYGYDAWLWVEVKQGLIQSGSNKGYPTYYVYLDGIEIGYITKYQMERHIGQVPEPGAVMVAHIPYSVNDIEKKQYQVKLQMLRAHAPVELTRKIENVLEFQSRNKKESVALDSIEISGKNLENKNIATAETPIKTKEIQHFVNEKPHKKTLKNAMEYVEIELLEETREFLSEYEDNTFFWVSIKAGSDSLNIRFRGQLLGVLPMVSVEDFSDSLISEGLLKKDYDIQHFYVLVSKEIKQEIVSL